jgi:hypothetical protein
MILTQEFLDMFVHGESSSDLYYQNSLDNVEWDKHMHMWVAYVCVLVHLHVFFHVHPWAVKS